MHIAKGFTLIELIATMVIVGVLAAVAAPRFVDLQTSANTAAINRISASVESMANTVHAACQIHSSCMGSSWGTVVFFPNLGMSVQMVENWPDAGELTRSDQIDDLITASGVIISSENSLETVRWSMPNTTNCYTQYRQPNNAPGALPSYSTVINGC